MCLMDKVVLKKLLATKSKTEFYGLLDTMTPHDLYYITAAMLVKTKSLVSTNDGKSAFLATRGNVDEVLPEK